MLFKNFTFGILKNYANSFIATNIETSKPAGVETASVQLHFSPRGEDEF